eukprot:scaffold90252_cov20-Tisochrysis_lutea.AAC.4
MGSGIAVRLICQASKHTQVAHGHGAGSKETGLREGRKHKTWVQGQCTKEAVKAHSFLQNTHTQACTCARTHPPRSGCHSGMEPHRLGCMDRPSAAGGTRILGSLRARPTDSLLPGP